MGIIIWVTLYIYALQGATRGYFCRMRDASLCRESVSQGHEDEIFVFSFQGGVSNTDLALIIKRYNFVKFSIKAHRADELH